MSAHTPGPWFSLYDDNGFYEIASEAVSLRIAFTYGEGDTDEANGRRIVACVNACEGIDTQALEIITSTGNTLRKRFETGGGISLAQLQRDQLLGFARDILGDWPDCGCLDDGDIQNIAVKHGLLKPTTVHEPCNGGDPDMPCACAEFCDAAEFAEGVTCYHKAEFLQGGAA